MALQENDQQVAWGANHHGQAAPLQDIRIAQPGILNIDSLQILVRASDGTLSADASITINLTNDPNRDTDGDGLSNAVETDTGTFVSENDTGTDPNNPDSDGDGWNDGDELRLGFSPLSAKSSPHLALDISPGRLPSGAIDQLNLSFPAKSGKSYRIEASSNLRDWEVLESGITGNGDTIQRSFPAGGATWFLRASEE